MTHIRSLWRAWLLALTCLVATAPALAQAPAISSLTVEQVSELAPGTELVFRANATANGVLRLKVDGVASLIEVMSFHLGEMHCPPAWREPGVSSWLRRQPWR